ncbi:MAG: hypothetical protein M1831_002653 [Alyxoria varia]|nr:MAG: hypothetical protein M1831_002653 [Alyxoria varia]
MFRPENQTPKVDFEKSVDLSGLKNQNVLITGGANGLGSLITRNLCAQGAKVTIADLNSEAGEKLVEGMRQEGQRSVFVQTDVTSWASQVNAFKIATSQSETKTLDLVIPCAGTAGSPLQVPETASWDEDPPQPATLTLDVTLKGVYFSTVLALHYFRASSSASATRKKHILFIGSLASYLEVPPMSDYTAAKFGVRGLWKSIRNEAREQHVRTNMLSPTFLPTQMMSSVSFALEEKGGEMGHLKDAVGAVVRLACTEDIDGR